MPPSEAEKQGYERASKHHYYPRGSSCKGIGEEGIISGLKRLKVQEQKFSAELDAVLKQYAELREQAADFEPLELYQARQALRSDKEQSAIRKVQNTYGKAYNSMTMFDAKREMANLLGEEAGSRSLRERLRQKESKHCVL